MNINPFKDEKEFKRITLENAEIIKLNNGLTLSALYLYFSFVFLKVDIIVSGLILLLQKYQQN